MSAYSWGGMVRPAKHRTGSGAMVDTGRTHAEWAMALAGHTKSAHKGLVKADCEGCKSLQQKLAESR
jgi:hypothetical protein